MLEYAIVYKSKEGDRVGEKRYKKEKATKRAAQLMSKGLNVYVMKVSHLEVKK